MLFLLPACVLLLIGWLVRYRQVTWLISGYNTASRKTKETYDTLKLTKHFGNFMFALAIPFLVLAILSVVPGQLPDAAVVIGAVVEAVLVVAGLVYLNTGNRVRKT